jgi:uncharacterized repeat protein (TIGR02543 family)
VTGNLTLYAEWIEQFTVTYDSNGGSAVSPESVDDGALATEPSDPSRLGFAFDGWYTDDETFLLDWDFASDTVIEDVTLYAKWVETPFFEDTVEGDLIALLPMFYVVAIVGFEVAIMKSGMSGPQKLTTALLVVVVGLALLPVIAAIVQSLVG